MWQTRTHAGGGGGSRWCRLTFDRGASFEANNRTHASQETPCTDRSYTPSKATPADGMWEPLLSRRVSPTTNNGEKNMFKCNITTTTPPTPRAPQKNKTLPTQHHTPRLFPGPTHLYVPPGPSHYLSMPISPLAAPPLPKTSP